MKASDRLSIHNRFDIEVIDARTGEKKQEAKAYNTILNRLWSAMGSYSQCWFQYLFYGSGSGTPSASDSTLFHHVAAVQFNGTNGETGCTYSYDRLNGIISCRRSIQLSESTAVGVELTEVGIGYGSSSDNLCTHAMLQDMNGNPISILKTNTDIINIYATVYIHHSQIGRIGLEGLDRMRYFFFGTNKQNGAEYFKNALGALFVSASKESGPFKSEYAKYLTWNSYDASAVTASWDSSTKKFTVKIKRMAVGDLNCGGIGSLWLGSSSAGSGQGIGFAFFVEDFYSGDNIVGEAVGTGDGTTKRFALDFDFPENASIYVDGVRQTSGVTVRRVPCNSVGNVNVYMPYLYPESTDSRNIVKIVDAYSKGGGSAYAADLTKVAMSKNAIIRNKLNNIGFAAVTGDNMSGSQAMPVYGSNDLSTWNLIGTISTNTIALDDVTGFYKYYKTGDSGSVAPVCKFTLNGSEDWKAVVFDEAPADGAVITADYHTPYIAKDSDHVFDFTYEIQMGEYAE